MDCDVFVKKVSFYDFEKIYVNPSNEFDSQSAALIAACIRLGEKGDEMLPYDVACQLHPSLGISLVTAINEVNKNTGEEKK